MKLQESPLKKSALMLQSEQLFLFHSTMQSLALVLIGDEVNPSSIFKHEIT